MAKFGIGQPVRRLEDRRLITGQGRYTDDISLPGEAQLVVVRSPHPHARIRAVRTDAAKAAPGVLAVMTAADMEAAGDNAIPCLVPMTNRDGSEAPLPKHPILVRDKARYVGDNVAFVVAETKAQARDAAELVEVDYEPLGAVADTGGALAAGTPPVHDECPGNLAYDWHYGDAAAADAAFAKARHVTRLELINNRLVCNPMEPRAAVAEWDAAAGSVTVHTCTQGPWAFRDTIASNLRLPADKVRVVTADVGGGFGMKAMFYPEYTMVAVAARKLGRPVKWTSERSEAFLSDSQGRDHVTTAELAFDERNRITAMRVTTVANMGAYYYLFAPYIPTGAALKVLPGVYDIPALSYGVKAVFTNTVPVDAYRGAGRPESIYCMERLIEQAAHELDVDVLELRRLNFVKPEQMPYKSSAGELYDSGEFARVMDACLAKADWAGVPVRKTKSAAGGKLRGIGMCYYIESTMGDQTEHAGVRFDDDGGVSVLVGTQSNGQGHETAYAQVLHVRLGVPFEKVRIVQGDTARIKSGGGTGGSRSLTAQWTAMNDASDMVIDKGKAYAAQVFEAAKADIAFDEGVFAVAGTDRRIGIMDLARKAKTMTVPGVEGGLDADASSEVKAWTFPNGCHIAEVEIDPDTGIVEVDRYNIVDDFGVILNPLLVEGQVHGGVVQGIGQALHESTVYDVGGQLLSGSFMDYCMPRADDMPMFDFSTLEVPCRNNPMGIKGCGEAGSVGSPAAVINAIIDALQPYGVKAVDMPATPERIWGLIHQQKKAA
jgi:carbon-monoxide dehydrogenase large subunit